MWDNIECGECIFASFVSLPSLFPLFIHPFFTQDDPRSHAERLKAMNDEVAETVADGQTFGADGKPVTNAEGKQLTPADMFSPGDVITVTVGKSNPKQDPGLKIEEVNGKVYVRKVPSSGLFAKTPVIALG